MLYCVATAAGPRDFDGRTIKNTWSRRCHLCMFKDLGNTYLDISLFFLLWNAFSHYCLSMEKNIIYLPKFSMIWLIVAWPQGHDLPSNKCSQQTASTAWPNSQFAETQIHWKSLNFSAAIFGHFGLLPNSAKRSRFLEIYKSDQSTKQQSKVAQKSQNKT